MGLENNFEVKTQVRKAHAFKVILKAQEQAVEKSGQRCCKCILFVVLRYWIFECKKPRVLGQS